MTMTVSKTTRLTTTSHHNTTPSVASSRDWEMIFKIKTKKYRVNNLVMRSYPTRNNITHAKTQDYVSFG